MVRNSDDAGQPFQRIAIILTSASARKTHLRERLPWNVAAALLGWIGENPKIE
jgi:hypothetical protein